MKNKKVNIQLEKIDILTSMPQVGVGVTCARMSWIKPNSKWCYLPNGCYFSGGISAGQ